MPAHRLELVVEAPELVVHPVEVARRARRARPGWGRRRGRGSRRARSPRAAPPTAGSDRRPTARGRSRAASASNTLPTRDGDEEIARGGERAGVLRDQRVRLRARRRRELIRERAELVVGRDRLVSSAGSRRWTPSAAVEREHAVDVAANVACVARIRRSSSLSPGGGVNPNRDSFVAGPSSDSAAAIDWSRSSQLCRARRRRASAACVAELLGVASGPHREELPELLGLRLQALIGRGPALKRPELLDARVRLPEDAEPEGADDDEQCGDQRERDQELRPHRDRDARDERASGRLPDPRRGRLPRTPSPASGSERRGRCRRGRDQPFAVDLLHVLVRRDDVDELARRRVDVVALEVQRALVAVRP